MGAGVVAGLEQRDDRRVLEPRGGAALALEAHAAPAGRRRATGCA